MTFDVTLRGSGGFSSDVWSDVKDFITFVKIGSDIRTDKISESGDRFITVDVFPTHIRTRYRGDNGADRKINYIHMDSVLGFDIVT